MAVKLPRTAPVPATDVPFFARRAGTRPRSGAPSIAGIALPRGSRCRRAWASDAPVNGAPALASRLAAAFHKTGLWPVLWYGEEAPEHYFGEAAEPAGAGDAGARAILRRKWERLTVHPANRAAVAPFGPAFPGLAPGSARTQGEAAAKDPFEPIARRPRDDPRYAHAWLVLVPANRPSDVLETLQLGITGTFADGEIATVLRSWEERFGAVLVELGPGSLTLVAARPATGEEQALRLAAEHWALAPPEDGGRAGTIRAMAHMLRGAPVGSSAASSDLAPHVWGLGWAD